MSILFAGLPEAWLVSFAWQDFFELEPAGMGYFFD